MSSARTLTVALGASSLIARIAPIGLLGIAAALSAPASAQVFLNLDGFGIGNGSGTVQTSDGPVSDSANINNLFFPQFGTDIAGIGAASRGGGFAKIATSSEFDSGTIRLQSNILAQGSSICEVSGCGNGSGTASVTTRATFRVSEEAVLFLGGYILAVSHVNPGIGGSGISSSTSNVVVTEGLATLFGRTIRNSNGTLTSETIPESGVARLFPGVDYAFTVSSSGDAQAFGLNSDADGQSWTLVTVRLFPPACPTVTAPSDVVHCTNQASAPAVFTVVASGALPRTVKWQRFAVGGWSDLSDGPVGGVGTVSGATTTTLTISDPGIVANSFRARVQNDCGVAFSTPAAILLCPADFDCDGFVTGDDFDAYVPEFINGDLAADFDGNGFVNGDDFDAYVLAFEGGC